MKYLQIAIYFYFFPIALLAQGNNLFHTISVPVDYADQVCIKLYQKDQNRNLVQY